MRHLSTKEVATGVKLVKEFIERAARIDAASVTVYGPDCLDEMLVLETIFNHINLGKWTADGVGELYRVIFKHADAVDAEKMLGKIEDYIADAAYHEDHGHFPGDAKAYEDDCAACLKAKLPITYEQLRQQDPEAYEFVTLFAELREIDRKAYDELIAEAREMAARNDAEKARARKEAA